jgi:hypothetical protein
MDKLMVINSKITQKKIELSKLLLQKKHLIDEKKFYEKAVVKYTLRLTPTLKGKLTEKAKEKKMPISEFIRGVLKRC